MIETGVDILPLTEIAAYLQVTKRTLYRLAQEGQLPAFKLGGPWRVRREERDRWITENIAKQQTWAHERS